MSEPEIKRVDTKIVYKNRWMTVREDRVRRPNGDHGLYGVVEKADFSLIIPFDGDRFHLVQQYRYPVDGRFWEFPQGAYELDPDADPTRVARGELKEETGLTAGSMIRLGKLFQAYGYANQAVHVFYATELSAGEANPEAEEAGMVTQSFTREQINSMVLETSITDLATVGALTLLDSYLANK